MHRLSIRSKSSLAEKLRNAVGGSDFAKTKQVFTGSATVRDDNGEDFRELYVMPKRKLRGQTQLEQATGRAEVKTRSRMDLMDRLTERPPRSEEMDPNNKWSDVWPAARTFNASVVPLPVRMGSRPNPEKRAPFKKEGNLELVKIPNFLHLTPGAIKEHCEAIKKFCTPYPPELLQNQFLISSELPISLEYNTYIHQGTNIRDIRSRVVIFKIQVNSLKLIGKQLEKFIRLAGNRYDEKTNVLTIITDRCHTRQQNIDYGYYLLTVLFHEAQKVENWEKMAEREDSLKVEFNGSSTKSKLLEIIEKIDKNGEENVEKFGKMWNNYRNTEETPEKTREYAKMMKEILGIPKIA